jgi:hypothetical protein
MERQQARHAAVIGFPQGAFPATFCFAPNDMVVG